MTKTAREILKSVYYRGLDKTGYSDAELESDLKELEAIIEQAKPKERYCGFHGGEADRATCATCHPLSLVERYEVRLLTALYGKED